MCGLVGVVAPKGRVPATVVRRALERITHRGPDDSGLESLAAGTQEVTLGSCRLSIIDLSAAGHMPMRDPKSGNWIAYNGEVYNYHEIRAELERLGHQFVSHSDTEVILYGYRQWGPDVLQRLRGMFAIALWDTPKQRMFLARDRLGIKPLYFAEHDGTLLFGSELRALAETGEVERKPNQVALAQYLAFGSVSDPETVFEGARALLPGHYLFWDGTNSEQHCYWDAAQATASMEGAAPAALPELLQEAISLWMVSDVPVSLFLSGGIDSSALAAVLHQAGFRNLSSFSLTFQEDEFNEARYSRLVADRFKTDHHEITVSQDDARDAIPGFLAALDQPSVDGLNSYLISQKVHERGFKVALSGLGGDELFAGYNTFTRVPKLESLTALGRSVPRFMRAAAARGISAAVATQQSGKLAAMVRGDWTPYAAARGLFAPAAVAFLLPGSDVQAALQPLRDAENRAAQLDAVNRVSYLELTNYMRNTLLRDSDVMSMAHSLELRVPLLDHRVVEHALAIPGRAKLDPNTPKSLLVSAVGALPPEIVHRPKQGFTLPFERWLRSDLRAEVERTLSAREGPLADLLDRGAVRRVWDDFQHGRSSWSRPWALYVLHQWAARNLS